MDRYIIALLSILAFMQAGNRPKLRSMHLFVEQVRRIANEPIITDIDKLRAIRVLCDSWLSMYPLAREVS